MRYGFFDDDSREYVIERPDTPRAWTNYLGNKVYGAIVTNNAGGYSFFNSSAQGRFMRFGFNNVPMDQPGRYFYLRDQQSGDYWSTSWQPVGKPLSEFQSECRHGTAYTKISSQYRGISSHATYFVPLDAHFEVWQLTVKNTGDKPRSLKLYTYMEYANEWHIHHDAMNLQYSQYIVQTQVQGNSIWHSSLGNLPEDPQHFENRDQGRHTFFTVVGANISGFETDREKFIGPYGDYSKPAAVVAGETTQSLAHGDNACATLCVDLELAPGQERQVLVLMGVGKPDNAGVKALARVPDGEAAERELSELKQYWHSRLGRLKVASPDADFDSMVNVWNAYNSLITYTWSRAASLVYAGARDGLGYRDTVQDLIGVLPAIADEAVERLELMITGQCSTGGAMPVVKPFNHRPGSEACETNYRADDCLWLFNTVPAYVKETGHVEFYDKVLPYADQGEGTVLAHLRRALEFNLERSGQHGLPCGLEADWNDCLKLGPAGESVFVAFQLRFGLREYATIAEYLKRPEEQRWALGQLEELDKRLQEHTWDGEWFLRAYRQDGSTIGSHQDQEGSIFLNAQSWAVLSGAASTEQAEQAMEAVHKRLATPYGLVLCDPAYRQVSPEVVRAVVYNAGQKENAGIFCHPQAWAVMAEVALGNADRAYEYYRAYMPSAYNDRAEVREIEPYVHCQSTHGKESQKFGASRLPWLSGTATWSYYCATNSLLGIQPEYDGLTIAPCLPSSWPEVRVERQFRDKAFNVHIVNGSSGDGVVVGKARRVIRLVFNGQVLDGNFIPESAFGDTNSVEVTLG